MSTMCGADCSGCAFKERCKGCSETCGRPLGGMCIAAEYIKTGGMEAFREFKKKLCDEFNDLHVEGMPQINDLFCLAGAFVNLEYPLPNGTIAKLLDDTCIYLGNQVENQFAEIPGKDRCYGLVAGMDFLLVCEYGCNGSDPEIIVFKKR